MGSTQTVTSGPPPISSDSSTSTPKFGVTLERVAIWSLPLAALLTLLVGARMAVGAGELHWTTAGLMVYALSVVVWLGLFLLKRAELPTAAVAQSPGTSPPRSTPSASGLEKPSPSNPVQVRSRSQVEPLREALIFARYADSLFPFLAVVSLIFANTKGALSHQQKWITTALLSFVGCFVVWIIHVMRPWIERKAPPLGTTGASPPSPGLLDQLNAAALPFFSVLAVAISLAAAAFTSQIKWLTAGIIIFSAYVAVILAVSIRTIYSPGSPSPTESGPRSITDLSLFLRANWFVRVGLPVIAIATFSVALAMGAHFHQLSWTLSGLVVFSACMIAWLLQSSLLFLTPPALTGSTGFSFLPPAPLGPALLHCALLTLLGLAIYKHEITYLEAALLAVLGGPVLGFSWVFSSSVIKDGPPQIESNWGGLGGGFGGWRLSESFAYLLCALTLAVCASFAFVEVHARSSTSVAIGGPSIAKSTTATPPTASSVGGATVAQKDEPNPPDQKSSPK
jgi:hypothetical protein